MLAPFFCWLYKVGQQIIVVSEKYLSPVLMLTMRAWMARIFWNSGILKISDLENTYFLFEYEYQVPLISPQFAALAATALELACPILLLIGLGTRLAALPLLAMTAVIQFTYTSHFDHLYWAFILTTIALKGPGALSIDAWIKHKVTRCKATI